MRMIYYSYIHWVMLHQQNNYYWLYQLSALKLISCLICKNLFILQNLNQTDYSLNRLLFKQDVHVLLETTSQ